MSTEIKPGQVWQWKDGRPSFEILHTTGSLAFYRILPDGEDHYAVPLSTVAIEAALVTNATPAPLDPAAVKTGDTVTLHVDPPDAHPAFTVAGETHSLGGSTVYLGGWRVDDLPDYVTLTDHQTAPEPLPTAHGSIIRVELAEYVLVGREWLHTQFGNPVSVETMQTQDWTLVRDAGAMFA